MSPEAVVCVDQPWETVMGVLIGMGAGAGKCPARFRLMPDDAYVSIVTLSVADM